MSECIHCDIHEVLGDRLEGESVDLAEIASKVAEVLADLILLAPIEERATLIADVIANLGAFVLEKGDVDAPQSDPRRH